MDSIIQEEDERVETWYLLAFCLCKLKKFQNAEECMKNVKMLIEKQKITDQEFLVGAQELEETLANGLSKEKKGNAKAQQDAEMADEDEGYETYSEEDVSDCSDDDMN